VYALCLGLFILNAWICHELFTAEFLHNLISNEGAFAALGRFFREHRAGYEWFPWFNGGMPIEFAYQPLLPALSALTGALTGWSDVRALHAVVAVAYCLAPVTLFLFAWDYSESIAVSLTAASALSVASPAAMLLPVLLETGPWGDLRLYNIVHYGEGSHNLGAALLPLALLFLRRGIVRGGGLNLVAAAALCGITVLASPFGAVDIVLGSVSIVLAEGRGVRTVLLTGLASWCWISPWLPPSLINAMKGGAWSVAGSFEPDIRTGAAVAAILAVLALVWFGTRRFRRPMDRFTCLFAVWICAIPLGFFWLGWSIVPMSGRYQIELEMAICLLFGIVAANGLSRAGPRMRTAALIVLVLAGVRQANVYRHFARGLIDPPIGSLDIRQTIEYRVTEWIDRNLPGQRTMVAGDTEYLFSVFSNNPQFSAGHEPTSPNPVQRMAVAAIYAGGAYGDRGAQDAVLWLKVFGNQAVYVPGPASRDNYRVYANARMFEGILPVLWHEEDDTIYAVPQRSPLLAHVIPRAAVVARRPRDGLDIEPVRAYAASLDDPSLPLADLAWTNPSHGVIHARMDREQVLSIQITYNRGWRARVRDRVNEREVPVWSDKLGLIVIEPGCDGDCTVDLSFGATPEAWICRMLSALATVAGIALLVRYFRPHFRKAR
jgi:hypothetical protein